jgi:hypothetical protein
MRAICVISSAIFLLGASHAQAVEIKNCDTITSVPDRLKCLQANEGLLKAAVEDLQQQIARLPKPLPPPSLDGFVRYNDTVTIRQPNSNPGREDACLFNGGAGVATLCSQNPSLPERWRLSPVR